ncbi:hypothetical protein H2204_002509 [Knufia peltigerae]|uniref:Laccase n=1 Tax=Knufia peltigerae TaxID=1002370 RepID=A0AA39D0C4_9EURO|nr:hypothetical protein H2204_002509 [Knufia peltigerae]
MDLVTILSNVLAAATPLDQITTNGLSTLGTLTTPLLPPFLTNNPITDGFPWGEHNCTNTNPYTSGPDTGVIRTYDFTISRGILSPDGYEKEVILVNNQFPGPTIEAHWGDTIEVTVTNNITTDPEGTTIHWHGFLQQETQWMDGAPGFSQCPIPPEKSFTYRFHASLFGTSWYHAHYSAQYTDGAVGAMVVYGPSQEDYDIDIGPILLSDWFHTDYYSIVKTVMSPSPLPPRPMSDNNLIQGKMSFNCSTATDKIGKCSEDAGVAQFHFQSGKRHRLRLINTGADATQQFSIDDHSMTVIANDFVPVEPYDTNVVTLAVGQRTDVIVEATGDSKGAYWIRSNATCTSSNQPYALAALYYDDADLTALPKSSPWRYQNVGCDNDQLGQTVPLYSIDLGEPANTMVLDMTAGKNASGIWLWYINNSSFRTDYNEPILLLTKDGKTTYDDQPDWNVFDMGNSSSYRFVINNHTPKPHPMHLHGHNMYILDVGIGSWNGTIIRPTNPQRRDVQMVPSNGYLVVQADADNPGSWALHCHMVFHGSGGLAVDILERPAIIKDIQIPEDSYQLCKDWQAFSATGEVDQIDSGL